MFNAKSGGAVTNNIGVLSPDSIVFTGSTPAITLCASGSGAFADVSVDSALVSF